MENCFHGDWRLCYFCYLKSSEEERFVSEWKLTVENPMD